MDSKHKETVKKIIMQEIKKALREDGEEVDSPEEEGPRFIRCSEQDPTKPSTGDMRYAATLGKYYEHISHEVMLMESGAELFKRKLVIIKPEEIKEICANIKAELSKVDDILNKTARA